MMMRSLALARPFDGDQSRGDDDDDRPVLLRSTTTDCRAWPPTTPRFVARRPSVRVRVCVCVCCVVRVPSRAQRRRHTPPAPHRQRPRGVGQETARSIHEPRRATGARRRAVGWGSGALSPMSDSDSESLILLIRRTRLVSLSLPRRRPPSRRAAMMMRDGWSFVSTTMMMMMMVVVVMVVAYARCMLMRGELRARSDDGDRGDHLGDGLDPQAVGRDQDHRRLRPRVQARARQGRFLCGSKRTARKKEKCEPTLPGGEARQG